MIGWLEWRVGEIVGDAQESGLDVRFLRKKSGKSGMFFVFPEVIDVEFFEYSTIIGRSGKHQLKRGKYFFPGMEHVVSDASKVW